MLGLQVMLWQEMLFMLVPWFWQRCEGSVVADIFAGMLSLESGRFALALEKACSFRRDRSCLQHPSGLGVRGLRRFPLAPCDGSLFAACSIVAVRLPASSASFGVSLLATMLLGRLPGWSSEERLATRLLADRWGYTS